MRKLKTIFLILIVLFCYSCSSDTKSTARPKPEKTASAATTIPVKPGFDPYTMMVVKHPIPSFDLWLSVFNAHDADRKASGLTLLRLGRGISDTNTVLIRMKADDITKAKEFSKALKADMRAAGRTADPEISYVTVIRDDSSFTEVKERALVSYHVKDFDSWLKVYDEKGIAIREPYGLIDRGLARGVDDPNTVYILFAVSDIKKAKARLFSSQLRRILRNAGMDGKMTVNFYRVVQ
jgi:hypothetical protein